MIIAKELERKNLEKHEGHYPRWQIESSCHHKVNNEFVRLSSTFIKIAVLSKEGVNQLGETKGLSKEPCQVDYPGDFVLKVMFT